jgi:hypothetical protein
VRNAGCTSHAWPALFWSSGHSDRYTVRKRACLPSRVGYPPSSGTLRNPFRRSTRFLATVGYGIRICLKLLAAGTGAHGETAGRSGVQHVQCALVPRKPMVLAHRDYHLRVLAVDDLPTLYSNGDNASPGVVRGVG